MHADIVVATTTRGDTTEKEEGIHYNTEIMEEKMIVYYTKRASWAGGVYNE